MTLYSLCRAVESLVMQSTEILKIIKYLLILVPLPVSASLLPAQKFAYYVSSMFSDILCKYGKVASSYKVVSSCVSVLFTSVHKLFIDI